MFIWVNQGIVEPYTPKLKHTGVSRVNPLHAGIPDKQVEVHPDMPNLTESPFLVEKVHSAYLQEEKPEVKTQIFYAKDIMATSLVTILPESSLEEIEIVFKSKKFRHIPVINPDQTLFGIVSERDLFRFTIERYRQSANSVNYVRDITKKKTLTAFPNTPIRDLARIMFEEKVGSVPILNPETYELVGIVTRSDILKAVMNFPLLELYG
jgi:acetoin utilization protein AcuB